MTVDNVDGASWPPRHMGHIRRRPATFGATMSVRERASLGRRDGAVPGPVRAPRLATSGGQARRRGPGHRCAGAAGKRRLDDVGRWPYAGRGRVSGAPARPITRGSRQPKDRARPELFQHEHHRPATGSPGNLLVPRRHQTLDAVRGDGSAPGVPSGRPLSSVSRSWSGLPGVRASEQPGSTPANGRRASVRGGGPGTPEIIHPTVVVAWDAVGPVRDSAGGNS